MKKILSTLKAVSMPQPGKNKPFILLIVGIVIATVLLIYSIGSSKNTTTLEPGSPAITKLLPKDDIELVDITVNKSMTVNGVAFERTDHYEWKATKGGVVVWNSNILSFVKVVRDRSTQKPLFLLIGGRCAGSNAYCEYDQIATVALDKRRPTGLAPLSPVFNSDGAMKSKSILDIKDGRLINSGIVGVDKLGDDLTAEFFFDPQAGVWLSYQIKEAYLLWLRDPKSYEDYDSGQYATRGRLPGNFYSMPIRDNFLKSVSSEEFSAFRAYSGVSTAHTGASVKDGRFLVIGGCKPQACNDSFSILVIDMTNNARWGGVFDTNKFTIVVSSALPDEPLLREKILSNLNSFLFYKPNGFIFEYALEARITDAEIKFYYR